MEVDQSSFAKSPPENISNLGFMIYPWSYKEGAINNPYRFKVWLDFYNLPSFGWRTEKIKNLVNTFGILLIHGPLTYLGTIERLRVVALVSNLQDVPNEINLHFKEYTTTIPVEYAGWTEQSFLLSVEPDFVPTPASIEEARKRKEAIRALKLKNPWQQPLNLNPPSFGNDNSMLVGESHLQDLLNAPDKEQAIRNLLSMLQKGKMAMAGDCSIAAQLEEDFLDSPSDGDTHMAT